MGSGAVVKGVFAVSATHALAHLLRPAQARLRWCAGALAEVAATCGRHLAAPAAWLRALRSYSAPALRAFVRGRLRRLAIALNADIQSGILASGMKAGSIRKPLIRVQKRRIDSVT
jgi:hypothetical protein